MSTTTQDGATLRELGALLDTTPRDNGAWQACFERYKAKLQALDTQLRLYADCLHQCLEARYGAALTTALAQETWGTITWKVDTTMPERQAFARWLQQMPIVLLLHGPGIDGWYTDHPFDFGAYSPVTERLLATLQQESTLYAMRHLLTWIDTPQEEHTRDPQFFFDAVFFIASAMECQGMSRAMQCLYFFRHLPYEKFEDYYNVSMEMDKVWYEIVEHLPNELRQVLDDIHKE
jgi:hypothetical protein